MYDFLSQNALYTVLVVVLLIWFGLLFYLFRLDRRVKRLEETTQK
ncbi:MAG: CcmD family protein [Bacteroidota bacterium]